jgi:hypothetical protein
MSTLTHPTTLRSILILSSHLSLDIRPYVGCKQPSSGIVFIQTKKQKVSAIKIVNGRKGMCLYSQAIANHFMNIHRNAETVFNTNNTCSSSGGTNCVNTTSGNCHTVSVAVSYAGRKRTSDLHTTVNRVTFTRGCVDTICLSWWWARCARNM